MSTKSEDISASASTRRLLRRNITRIKDYVNEWSKANVSDSVERLELLIPELNSLNEKFDQSILTAFNSITTTDPTEIKKIEDELFKEQDEVHITVLSQIAKINGILRKLSGPSRESLNESSVSSISNQQPVPDIRLPKIEIPEFDGDPRKFMKFKSMFQNMIHDEPKLTNVRKLVYLQKALIGKAEEFFRDVDINDAASYPTIWREFLQRYENKRVIIRAHFNDLFSIKQIKDESGLRRLLDDVTSSLRGLKICGEHTDQWSSILCYLVLTKLDDQTKRDFENSVNDKTKFPPFELLKKFIEGRATAVEDRAYISSHREKQKPSVKSSNTSNIDKSETSKKSFASSTNKCVACGSQHLLLECKVFLAKTPSERLELIKKNRLCLNCFGRNHLAHECRNRSCKTCNQKHHTMLHIDRPASQPSSTITSNTPAVNSSSVAAPESTETKKVFTTMVSNEIVILPTAVVRFKCGSIYGKARILIDPASQATMVSDTLIRHYRLPTTQSLSVSSISGVGDSPALSYRSCSLTLLSRINQFQMPITCDVVPPVTIKYEISVESLNLLKSKADYVQFADESLPYRHVDIILGAKYAEKCFLNQTISIDEATLRNSVFGWVAVGAVPADSIETKPSNFSYAVSYHSTISAIEAKLRKLCDSDEFYEPVNSKEEQVECNRHFETTYQRNEAGKFVVRLPKKDEPSVLSDSRTMALKFLSKIERAPPSIQAEYHRFISEYEQLNHLKFYDLDTDPSTTNYILPLLLVVRPDKSTTKLRVVFHASFKTRDGKSLNEILMVGPTLQMDLFDIIIRFRRHPIAFAADIEKMYRQILVHPEDQILQKIYYRSPSSTLKVGILRTVTYGTAPASFIATKCLSVLADELQQTNPSGAEVIRADFYMDDLITGSDSIEEAIQLQQTVSNQLATAHFPLRKYCSNSDEFLQSLDPSLIEPLDHRDITLGNVKILGLRWIPGQDNMGIVSRFETLPDTITKRIMLSEIASIFDVVGVLAPVTIRSKLLMQELWREKIDWDSPIPFELEKSFRNYYTELANLTSFSFDRHYHAITSKTPYELIGFCDASEHAYCAVLYIRALEKSAKPTFVCAKTKVAPLKQPTIPRLELQAALLLARLVQRITKTFGKEPTNVYAFSDSTIILSWLNKPPSTWKQYVSNRVSSIVATLPPNVWRYVNTKENPADLATRGISVKQFSTNRMWLDGPQFLSQEIPPPFNQPESSKEVLSEQKSTKIANVATTTIEQSLIAQFSSYHRLIRVVAYIRRFAEHSRNPTVRSSHHQLLLSPEEFTKARTCVIRYIQHCHYPKEVKALKASSTSLPKSCLLSLSPFLDEQGVLRVGGRLRKSNLAFSKKHPIILPAQSLFVELYVRFIHQRYFHATKSFIITFVNAEFWIVGSLSNIVKRVIHSCTTCIRYRGESLQQIMGQLPTSRITECNAFSHVGIDFAGPFECKCTGHRTTKSSKIYIAIFVCLSSRAVHIEIVSNLTTAAFLDALKRFIGRRGLPTTIFSDNGRTFVGANNYLDLTTPDLAKFSLDEGISWKFIPPRAPDHGGVWEAAVKSAKYHFKRVIGSQVLNFEEYNTFFTQTEAILNSRPLCYRHTDDKSYVAITPAHLVIGRPLLTAVDGEPPKSASINARYALRETILRSFWSSWRKDYLNQLQAKYKWRNERRNLQPGDIVLIKEDNLPPSTWPLAIVEAVQPDTLGNVRVVHLRSTHGSRTRSVRQLVPLLLDEPRGSSPGEPVS